MKIKEVIVVEGKDDTAKIKAAVDADTIETNGSAIDEEVLDRIKHAQSKRGIIIFTDPDYPGERIRHIVDQHVPNCKHAFLPKDQARAKRDKGIGIEHASIQDIRTALSSVYELVDGIEGEITKQDLIDLGLIGGSRSTDLREQLGLHLRIGKTNGKQLLKRLNMFHITPQQLGEAMKQIMQEENNE
ncbi:ribonuclease M5 [Halobacillus sp. ACCC02827]|uniref:ribonuclease M5 n=1 Tax=Bacillaceae TaxID=186817 RepID=UPI0002A4EC3E|nr:MULTISPECIES: ribonuclease M5 [Bacillaceae]ELK48337.1 ribonuclease M5 [Halobacillus sp. BAB-2008]QHT45101.1 ribonuclease M5 [Bacillus sp. SB49]WJE15876.1 ribonuclease M5 [Halobacillus sp. ACCC02827]